MRNPKMVIKTWVTMHKYKSFEGKRSLRQNRSSFLTPPFNPRGICMGMVFKIVFLRGKPKQRRALYLINASDYNSI